MPGRIKKPGKHFPRTPRNSAKGAQPCSLPPSECINLAHSNGSINDLISCCASGQSDNSPSSISSRMRTKTDVTKRLHAWGCKQSFFAELCDKMSQVLDLYVLVENESMVKCKTIFREAAETVRQHCFIAESKSLEVVLAQLSGVACAIWSGNIFHVRLLAEST